MPDQYTLAALQRLELDKEDTGPIMAEVDLVSSHWPWAPLPRIVDWEPDRRRLDLRSDAGRGRVAGRGVARSRPD